MDASWAEHDSNLALYWCTGWLVYFSCAKTDCTVALLNPVIAQYLSRGKLHISCCSSWYRDEHADSTLPKACSITEHGTSLAYSKTLVLADPCSITAFFPAAWGRKELATWSARIKQDTRFAFKVAFTSADQYRRKFYFPWNCSVYIFCLDIMVIACKWKYRESCSWNSN